MCGRYATTRSAVDIGAIFAAIDDSREPVLPDYNVAPTDRVPIIRMSRRLGGRALSVAAWGLRPAWAPPRGAASMINARAETVATSRAFGPSFARRRCLVPADGWYEWVRLGKARQAYFMSAMDGGPLAFAGLWTGAAPDQLSFTIVTTAAQGGLARVHDRMPLLLPAHRWARWLAGPPDVDELLPAPPPEFVAGVEVRAVGPAVGNVRNDGPELVARVPDDDLAARAGDHETPTLF